MFFTKEEYNSVMSIPSTRMNLKKSYKEISIYMLPNEIDEGRRNHDDCIVCFTKDTTVHIQYTSMALLEGS